MIGETVCWVSGFYLFVWVLKLAEKYLDIATLSDLFAKSRLRAAAEEKSYPGTRTLLLAGSALSLGIVLRLYGI